MTCCETGGGNLPPTEVGAVWNVRRRPVYLVPEFFIKFLSVEIDETATCIGPLSGRWFGELVLVWNLSVDRNEDGAG